MTGKSEDARQTMTEQERVERFEAAYNRIDRALAELTERRDSARRHTFAAKVRQAAHRMRRLAPHVDFLLEVGDLRNALVHSRTDIDVYIAVPNQETVEQIERIEKLMFAPEKVVPRFQRRVTTLRPDQTLADALAYIRQDGYSRYPVYGREGFVGLLTSNGVARWYAAHTENGVLKVDAGKISVADVLRADHRRNEVAFVSREEALGDVAQLFVDRRQLEAVLITERGVPHEKPIGLICAADIVGG